MNDRELDQLIASAVQAQPAPADSPALGRGRYELLEEIMSTPIHDQVGDPGPANHDTGRETGPVIELTPPGPRPPSGRRGFSTGQRWAGAVAVAAAVAAAVIVPAKLFRGSDDVPVREVHSAAQLAQAQAGPLIALDDPDYVVDHVDQDGALGEISWASGDKTIQLNWYGAADYQSYYDDRLNVSPAEKITVLGAEGALFTYDAASDYAVIMPVESGKKYFVEYRIEVGDRAAMTDVLGKLKRVTADEWLDALPASVVKPADEAATADAMLEGVPLPPGFDVSKLPTGQANDYYLFGSHVTGSVYCGWLDIYKKAYGSGDEATMATVDEALATTADWPVLQKMASEGDWGPALEDYAARVHDRKDVGEIDQSLNCMDYRVS